MNPLETIVTRQIRTATSSTNIFELPLLLKQRSYNTSLLSPSTVSSSGMLYIMPLLKHAAGGKRGNQEMNVSKEESTVSIHLTVDADGMLALLQICWLMMCQYLSRDNGL
jgi:hypothetical protein